MSTFTIDLLTGQEYLFHGDFANSGATFFTGITSGNNGLSLGAPHQLKLGGTLICSTVLTKGVGNTAGIEYGGDYSASYSVRSLVDKGYADTKASKSSINTFTGTTLPTNYFNKTQISTYTGTTNTRIQGIESDITYISGVTDTKLGITRTAVTGATYTPTINDVIIGILGTTTSVVNINLPNISIANSKVYWIFKDEGFNAGTNNINFNAFAGDLIEKQTTVSLVVDGGSITIYNDGISNWYVV